MQLFMKGIAGLTVLISGWLIAAHQDVLKDYIDRWARSCRIAISAEPPAVGTDRFRILMSTSGVMPQEFNVVASIRIDAEVDAPTVPKIKEMRLMIPTAGQSRLISLSTIGGSESEGGNKVVENPSSLTSTLALKSPLRGADHLVWVKLDDHLTSEHFAKGWQVFGFVALGPGIDADKHCRVSSESWIESAIGADNARVAIALAILIVFGTVLVYLKKG